MASVLNVCLAVTALHFTASTLLLAPVRAEGQVKVGELAVAGWVEDGWIGTPPIRVKVKLDTGAKISSIHAAQYRDYMRDGIRRVSFTLVNNEGQELKIDEPVVRTASIRRGGVELRERPVIRLKFCVAGLASEAEFSMADRSDLSYPVVLGRAFLAGRFLVDSARTFQASVSCKPHG
ncbi:MAG: RimK/LysX family protein [Hyphomicrobiaceae bacterium]|nr:RimK/LysX family protein [Hyphomicrobiaceae bacterium]